MIALKRLPDNKRLINRKGTVSEDEYDVKNKPDSNAGEVSHDGNQERDVQQDHVNQISIRIPRREDDMDEADYK
jgi:hypothetical protein